MARYDLVCIGDAFCDVIAARLPKLPGPNRQAITDIFLVRGGETANTAAAAARLGLKTAFIGRVGGDLLGEWFKRQMGGVDAIITRDRKKDTALTLALSIGKGDRRFVSSPGANESLGLEDIDFKLFEKARHVLRGGFWHTQKLLGKNRLLFKSAKECGCSTSLNMGWDYGGWTKKRKGYVQACLPFLDFLFLNERELSALAKSPKVLRSKGVKNVVVHKGENGCEVIGSRGFSSPAFNVRVANPVGAGDVFNAGFVYGFLKDWDLERAAEFANAAAALHISKKDFLPTAGDVKRFVRKR